jgi:hypothetical protein
MTRRAIFTWFVLAVIGVANGVLRQATYGRAVNDLAAHQISTVTCVAGVFTGAYLMMRHSVAGVRDRALLLVGIAWAAATIAFEFGLGHFVNGDSWSSLLHAYDVRAGQLWAAVPFTILLSPLGVKRLVTHAPRRRVPLSAS